MSSIFREAVEELLPNIPRRLVYSALKAKLDKDNDKITVRTKSASLAKIRIARDFARCKVVGVIVKFILDHNRTYTAPGEKMEVPSEWIQSTRMEFVFDTDSACYPTSCSRPEMKYHPYHAYLLFHVESALRSSSNSGGAGTAKKKQLKLAATFSAFAREVESPLLSKNNAKSSTGSKSRAVGARSFLDTNEVDVSKLKRLRSMELKPTFASLCSNICVTYDVLEVASLRLKAITALALEMKLSLQDAEETLRDAEATRNPKARRGKNNSPGTLDALGRYDMTDRKLDLIINAMKVQSAGVDSAPVQPASPPHTED